MIRMILLMLTVPLGLLDAPAYADPREPPDTHKITPIHRTIEKKPATFIEKIRHFFAFTQATPIWEENLKKTTARIKEVFGPQSFFIMEKFKTREDYLRLYVIQEAGIYDFVKNFREEDDAGLFPAFNTFVEWSRFVSPNTIRLLDLALAEQLDYCLDLKGSSETKCIQSLLNPGLHVSDLLGFDSLFQERAQKHRKAILKAAASYPAKIGFWVFDMWDNTIERFDTETVVINDSREKAVVSSIYLATLSLIYPERLETGTGDDPLCDLAKAAGHGFLCNSEFRESCFGADRTRTSQGSDAPSGAGDPAGPGATSLGDGVTIPMAEDELAVIDEQQAKRFGCGGGNMRSQMGSLLSSIPSSRACLLRAVRQMAIASSPAKVLALTALACRDRERDQQVVDSQHVGVADPGCKLGEGEQPNTTDSTNQSGETDKEKCRKQHGNDINRLACETLDEQHVNNRTKQVCREGDRSCAASVGAAHRQAAREARLNFISEREARGRMGNGDSTAAFNPQGTSDGRDNIYIVVENTLSMSSNDFLVVIIHEIDHRVDEILGRPYDMGTHADIYEEGCRLGSSGACQWVRILGECSYYGSNCDVAGQAMDVPPDWPGGGGDDCSAPGRRFNNLVVCTTQPIFGSENTFVSSKDPIGPRIYTDNGGGGEGIIGKAAPLLKCHDWSGGISKGTAKQIRDYCLGGEVDPPDFCTQDRTNPACKCASYSKGGGGVARDQCSGSACPDDSGGEFHSSCGRGEELYCGFREPPFCRCVADPSSGGPDGGDPMVGRP